LVVASPVEDYFLYIDDLPYPEKVRIYDLVSGFFFFKKNNIYLLFIIFLNIKSKVLYHYLIIDDSKKLRKLRDLFLMLLEMTIQFVARVR
jgi:hypothetical protein